MLKLVYASHKLRVKHATRRAIHLEDSVAATQRLANPNWVSNQPLLAEGSLDTIRSDPVNPSSW